MKKKENKTKKEKRKMHFTRCVLQRTIIYKNCILRTATGHDFKKKIQKS